MIILVSAIKVNFLCKISKKGKIYFKPLAVHLLSFRPVSAPLEAPVILEAYNTSAFSIYLRWTASDGDNIPGILRYYRISYQPVNTTLGPEKSVVVNKDRRSVVILGLMIWTNYTITVAAGTIKDGPRSNPVNVSTDDKVLPRTCNRELKQLRRKFQQRFS